MTARFIGSSNKKLWIALLAFVFIAAINLNAQNKKILRWAADAESGAPYAFQDPKNPQRLIGFEVDLINEIAKVLGMKAQHFQMEWDGLIQGLDRKDYDVAINGLEITDDRKEVVNYSYPYYITYETIVVRKDQQGINSLSDLIGRKVGTLDGSLAERILKAKEGINVLAYDSEEKSYNDLENGRLDAVLIDDPVVQYYASWNPQLKLVGQPIGEIEYGIVLRKTDTQLLSQINGAINKLIENGKLREILEHWNMWNPMMAKSLNDHAPSNIPHTRYIEYIEQHNKKLTVWDKIKRYVSFSPMLLQATGVTMSISLVSMVVAIIVGLVLVLLRVYAPKPFSSLAVIFIEMIRGTPLLLQLYFIFYALPSVGIKISPVIAAIIGLGFNYGAYEAENYRAGIFSVPRGQMEAAISLGMTRNQALRHVILPQAIRLVIPPMTNDFISLLKDSSLVSVITMVELTKVYNQLGGAYFDYVGIGLIVCAIYLVIGLPFVKLAKLAERRFTYDKRKVVKN